jgi:hypothetical protein
MPGNVERRPTKGPAPSKGLRLTELTDGNSTAGRLLPVDPLDAIAAHVDGCFVVCVKTSGGRYRRRCFLSAASAEKAARNAQAAGHNAVVFLAELKPLWRLAGDSGPDLFSAGGTP